MSIDNYRDVKKKADLDCNRLMVLSSRAGILRLVFFSAAAVFTYFSISSHNDLFFVPAVICLFIFITLVKYHNRLKERNDFKQAVSEECERGMRRVKGEWTSFQEDGSEFIDNSHPFSADIDIFGKGSLYQMIQCCSTEPGKRELAALLSITDPERNEILQRQQAVKELAGDYAWRITYTAAGRLRGGEAHNPEELASWAVTGHLKLNYPPLKYMVRFAPAAMLLSAVLAAFSVIPLSVPAIVFVINALAALPGLRMSSREFAVTERYRNDITRYYDLIAMLQRKKFSSEMLKKLQASLLHKKGAEAALKQLETMVELSHMRFSSLHGFVNFLFLWDYNVLVSLNKWKKQHGEKLILWIHAAAYCEALCSLSVLNHDNPRWILPKISDHYEAFQLGHPLIEESRRVCNDVSIKSDGDVLLITGSNMSGKSTLLRSVALSLVMSYSGAAVCSERISIKVQPVYTSMRINDNLEKNISSFYAEIDRIATIVKAAEKKQIYFFLDEIFRGTNSEDRRTGARSIIKYLSKLQSAGMVSTHDLELAQLEEDQHVNLYNYHFREKYIEEKIYFDYTLYDGVSTTRDAVYLMRMIGLPVDENDIS